MSNTIVDVLKPGDLIVATRVRESLIVTVEGIVQEVRPDRRPIVFLENPADPKVPYGIPVGESGYQITVLEYA